MTPDGLDRAELARRSEDRLKDYLKSEFSHIKETTERIEKSLQGFSAHVNDRKLHNCISHEGRLEQLEQALLHLHKDCDACKNKKKGVYISIKAMIWAVASIGGIITWYLGVLDKIKNIF